MSETKSRLPLWPFVIVDVVFLGLAALVPKFCHRPLLWQEAGLMILCGALGSWSLVTPFLRRKSDEQALSQFQLLTEAANKIQKLDEVAGQIARATSQWTELQVRTAQASDGAAQLFNRMSAESKAFQEFMQRAGEMERNHLRVEVEKLRRAEGDCLQVNILILDHVFALFQAARHSGQPALEEQIGQFQHACHDGARRIGLVQTLAVAGEHFDIKLHQLPPDAAAAENATVADTIAPGYTYQGQLLRCPMVVLKTTGQ
jgi:hypothetical protein